MAPPCTGDALSRRDGRRLDSLGALTVEGPAIVDAAVVANELPNMPHLDLEQLGFALAKAKEAVLAVTGG